MGEYNSPTRFFLHPASPSFRWVFLFFLCFLTFGSYWSYDIPSAIHDPLIKDLGITEVQFGLLYSVYNFMNIGIVLFGGVFIDRMGLRAGGVLFCFFIALGQVIVSVGVSLPNHHAAYIVMLIGRIVFSIGGESLSVAQSTYCSKWYKGKDLALSFGITLSFARFGSYANFVVTPKMAQNIGIPFAVWFGTVTCGISVVMTVLAAISDKVRDKYVKTEEVAASAPFHIRDVLHFPPSLWLIYLICVFYYIGIFTLISVCGSSYFEAMWHFGSNTGSILGLPYLMAIALAPIFGFLVGKIGWKPVFLLLAVLIMNAAYVVLLWAPNVTVWSPFSFTMYAPPLFGMILMGFSYSLCAASLWPCVPLLVDENKVGSAYGIMNSIQNGGLALAASLVGLVGCSAKTRECTAPPLELLAGIGLFTLLLTVLLIIYDLSHGRKLTTTKPAIVETGPTEQMPLLNDK